MPTPNNGQANLTNNDDTQNPPVTQTGGEENDDTAGNETGGGSPQTPTPPAPPVLTEQQRIEAAVAAALSRREAELQAEATRKAAEASGNFQQLYEDEKKERERLQRDRWRGEALQEVGLDHKWFDSIQGSTKEEMVAFATTFKKHLDAELKAATEQIVDEHPGTPLGGGRGSTHRAKTKPSAAQKTNQVLKGAFGVSTLPRSY